MTLKEKLKNKELTIGSWVTIGHPAIVDIMASAGFEWLVVDMEHTSIDLTMAHNLIATIQANGMKALVRVSQNEEVIIKKILDMGADGVVIPMINNKKDALRAIDHVMYPPVGKRGVGLFRAQNYGIGFKQYVEKLNNEIIIIAQIEHIEAVNNLEEILSVSRIDGIIVGPYDLSASMGYPGDYSRSDVKEALKRIEEVALKMQKTLGFHVIESDHKKMLEKISKNYNFIAFSLDFFFLGDKAREEMLSLKNKNKKI